MTKESIFAGMETKWAGCEIVYYDETDSTNKQARMLAREGAAHGTLVIADRQSAGRGRRGRSWISPAGEGVFMSLIVRPDAPPSEVAKLSLTLALAVSRAIERETGLDARIKWPNDIVIGGRKVCGLLLEMDATAQKVESIVAGVGINVHQTAFDEEIENTASSLDLLLGKRVSRSAIVRAFLTEFERAMTLADEEMMDAYRERSATIGQRVQVIGLSSSYTGMATGITESGTLLVAQDDGGEAREVLAADVSVRGIMGYV